jgi:AcrR family transcriptional regulator
MTQTASNLAATETEVLDKDTEKRLLDAAGQLFAERGFDGAKVRDVCEKAGVKNVGAVNYYFRSKENLYEQALRHAFFCRFAQQPAPDWPPETPPRVKLRQFIERAVRHFVGDSVEPWQMKLLMRELLHPGPAGEGLVRDFIRPVYGVLFQLLREVLPGEVDERKVHLLGFSIMGQCFYQRVARPVVRLVVGAEEHDTYDPALLAEHIANFSLSALGLDTLRTAPLTGPAAEQEDRSCGGSR